MIIDTITHNRIEMSENSYLEAEMTIKIVIAIISKEVMIR